MLLLRFVAAIALTTSIAVELARPDHDVQGPEETHQLIPEGPSDHPGDPDR